MRVLMAFCLLLLMACKHDNKSELLQEPFKNAADLDARISLIHNLAQPVYNVAFLGKSTDYDSSSIDSLIKNGHAYRFFDSISAEEITPKKQEVIIDGLGYFLLVVNALEDAKRFNYLTKKGSVILYSGQKGQNALLNEDASRKIRFGNGGLAMNTEPHGVLNMMQADPQFIYPHGLSVKWKQYRFGRIDIFVVENTSNVEQQFEAGFGTLAGAPELWNPTNGQMFAVDSYYQLKGTIRFKLSLEPKQTLFYVFGTNTDRDNMETYRL